MIAIPISKPRGRAKGKDPKMRVCSDHKGSLNAAAAALLSQDNERFIAVRLVDGAIELRPLALPEDTVTIVTLTEGRFVHLSRFVDAAKVGDVFDCDWMDGDGVMMCRRRGAVPEKLLDWKPTVAKIIHGNIKARGRTFVSWDFLSTALGHRTTVYRWASHWGFSAKAQASAGGVWFDLLPDSLARSTFEEEA